MQDARFFVLGHFEIVAVQENLDHFPPDIEFHEDGATAAALPWKVGVLDAQLASSEVLEMQVRLARRGLCHKGTKQELLARLRSLKASQQAAEL